MIPDISQYCDQRDTEKSLRSCEPDRNLAGLGTIIHDAKRIRVPRVAPRQIRIAVASRCHALLGMPGLRAWWAALAITSLSVPCAAAARAPALTARELVALAEAGRQRYFSLSYSIIARDYRPSFSGAPLSSTPQTVSRQLWRWSPWRIFYRETRVTRWPGRPAQSVSVFRSWDGSVATYLIETHPPAVAGQKRAAFGSIGRTDPIIMHTSLVSSIWSSVLWAGVNNANSRVTWDSTARQYVLRQSIARGGPLLQYTTWIDPHRGFVVVRDEMTRGGKVFHSDHFYDWHRVGRNLWLPFSIVTQVPGMFAIRSRIQHVWVVNRGIPGSLFRVKFPVGTIVANGIRLGHPYVVRSGRTAATVER
jgi:hypothetical protein